MYWGMIGREGLCISESCERMVREVFVVCVVAVLWQEDVSETSGCSGQSESVMCGSGLAGGEGGL